ncbi:hypothetical protein [Candidatus Leptofilum sp.]|uniref:hypothetical protein n=1 Tax=Candidatus Leptofilum sp. TaxID=3241576 RepID=UPI003B598525
MKRIFLLLLTLGFLALAACSPDYEAVADLPTATAAPSQTSTVLPTETAVPTQTSTAAPTFTPQPTETAVPPTATATPTPTMVPVTAVYQDNGTVTLDGKVIFDIEAESIPCFPDIPTEIIYAPTNEHFLVIPACIEGDNFLYLFKADGTEKQLITEPWDFLNFNNVTWAEDGQSFVYERINSCCLTPPDDAPPPGLVRYDLATGEKQLVDENGFAIYNDISGIWLLPLDNSQSPPVASAPRQIVAAAGITRMSVSPDGQHIAYVVSDGAENKLGVVTPSGDGKILVDLATLPYPTEFRYANVIYQFTWLPDSQTIAFNTLKRSLDSGFVEDRADLWLITTDGALTEKFPTGTAGYTFALSPDGTQLLFGNLENIIRINLDGSQAEEVLTFPYVITYSEFEWAPLAQWSPDGAQAYVDIAPINSVLEEAASTLYQIPATGTAVALGSINNPSLYPPPSWNHDASYLGYVLEERVEHTVTEHLVLTDGDGSNPTTFGAADSISVAGWNEAGTHFLYSGALYVSDNLNFLGIAQPNQSGLEALLDGKVGRLMWLNNSSYMIAIGSMGEWELFIGDLAGNLNRVGETAVDRVWFARWSS